jgi:hypothetical protein
MKDLRFSDVFKESVFAEGGDLDGVNPDYTIAQWLEDGREWLREFGPEMPKLAMRHVPFDIPNASASVQKPAAIENPPGMAFARFILQMAAQRHGNG